LSYADRGYLAVYTTCAPENTTVVSALILDELDAVRREGITTAELLKAQITYEGALARHFETVLSVANIIGIEELLAHVEPFPESIQQIRNVTAEEVQEAATRLLAGERFAIAAVGRRWDNG
jgi:predicted Zn-dependent peptidase